MATKTTDQRTVAELEAAILDGDASITAEMLNAARLRDQHTALLTEARIRREQAEARAARGNEVERLRGGYLGLLRRARARLLRR